MGILYLPCETRALVEVSVLKNWVQDTASKGPNISFLFVARDARSSKSLPATSTTFKKPYSPPSSLRSSQRIVNPKIFLSQVILQCWSVRQSLLWIEV
jgi:hypothetical protein